MNFKGIFSKNFAMHIKKKGIPYTFLIVVLLQLAFSNEHYSKFPQQAPTIEENILDIAGVPKKQRNVSRAQICAAQKQLTKNWKIKGPQPEGFEKVFIGSSIVENPVVVDPFSHQNTPAEVVIDIDTTQTMHKMWGFGASLTESCAHHVDQLPQASRKLFMERAFRPDVGAGFSYLRIPLGASDFSMDNFTLNDTPNNTPDPKLKHFDFSRMQRIVNLIKEAQIENPQLKFVLSPWTAPVWMKTPQQWVGGSLNPNYYRAYARYLVRSLIEFKKHGVDIEYLTILNEPYILSAIWDYPQMAMTSKEQVAFIRNHLAPLLIKERQKGVLDTKLLVLDHNWDTVNELDAFMQDPVVESLTAGVAFHCYGGDQKLAMMAMKNYPKLAAFMTECTALLKHNSVLDFTYWTSHFSIEATDLGLTGALGWNLCLDEAGGPTNKGCPDCRGMMTIDSQKGMIVNPEMHALEVVSRHTKQGAYRLAVADHSAKGVRSAAFLNPDGSVVFAARNDNETPIQISLRNSNCQVTTATVTGHSTITLTW